MGLVLLLWAKWASYATIRTPYIGWDNLVFKPLFFGATSLMLVGLWTRAASLLTALSATFLFFRTGDLHHHTYLLVAVSWLLTAAPCGRSFSLDSLRQMRQGRAVPEMAPLGAHRLISIQVSAIYFWGAIAKCNYRFVSGAGLEYLFLQHLDGVWVPVPEWIFPVLAVSTVGVELLLSFGLWIDRLRNKSIMLGVLMHLTFYILWDIGTFSATMLLLYVLFVPPAQVHRFLDELVARPAHRDGGAVSALHLLK